jgi:LEA14-like dessication related protein
MASPTGTLETRTTARARGTIPMLLGALACASCTPLGLWDYTDPRVQLGGIQLALDAGAEPLGVVLAVNNPNFYEMTVTGAEARLQLDGRAVGRGVKSEASTLPQRGTAELRVSMPTSDSMRRALSATLRQGSHRYAVQGHVTLQTPFGSRRVPFAATGRGEFGQIAQ